MAFNVFFKAVENDTKYETKGAPWLCDNCRREDPVLLRIKIDFDTLILCKKCLLDAKRLITNREKEIKNEREGNIQP